MGFESMSTLPPNYDFGPDAIVPKAGMPVTSDKHFTGFFHDKINLSNGLKEYAQWYKKNLKKQK